MVMELLHRRIEEVDPEAAKADIVRFIRNPRDLDVWSKDYFIYSAGKIIFN